MHCDLVYCVFNQEGLNDLHGTCILVHCDLVYRVFNQERLNDLRCEYEYNVT